MEIVSSKNTISVFDKINDNVDIVNINNNANTKNNITNENNNDSNNNIKNTVDKNMFEKWCYSSE